MLTQKVVEFEVEFLSGVPRCLRLFIAHRKRSEPGLSASPFVGPEKRSFWARASALCLLRFLIRRLRRLRLWRLELRVIGASTGPALGEASAVVNGVCPVGAGTGSSSGAGFLEMGVLWARLSALSLLRRFRRLRLWGFSENGTTTGGALGEASAAGAGTGSLLSGAGTSTLLFADSVSDAAVSGEVDREMVYASPGYSGCSVTLFFASVFGCPGAGFGSGVLPREVGAGVSASEC